ncbi:type I glyceraldehyde-3-phosphate dehydrogenase [Amycolatopsis acidicola]|uniref:Type I glyceraldehyde-3-phosphate dehydrogenase n=1 Tax=Amycolatopsis acidicola TaxID=2596893 RepID=A0A5N0V6U6_9PSEU|nr:type I glyceraldehyde-3-phosphate dehydrogenase [Amycolatopsis acidicola]KAA9160232.1 type I glyceraldehyde-3-phosphate dehydrogenase [Amycolatopsis acidicola]
MVTRVAINGLGRIGRDVLRGALARPGSPIEVVAVNDVVPPAAMAHLLEFDSTYGRLASPVHAHGSVLSVDGKDIHVTDVGTPAGLPWREFDVDIVIEASGKFRTRDEAAGHLEAGARKVIITAPGKDVDATIVLGINDESYDTRWHHVVSNASCTTNCVAPMAMVLHRAFGVRRGLMTTIHSYTNDQSLLDGPHQDPRRARSAAVNLIPTSTGAARALGEVLPELAGRLDGVAVRVPVEDGSLTDLTVELDEEVTAGQVNHAFAEAANGSLKGILRYTERPIVSRDVIGDPASCVFDSGLTKAEANLVKVFGWYDNEWGYAQRTLDLAELIAGALPG